MRFLKMKTESEVIADYDFTKRGVFKYPWDLWLDGRTHVLVQGQHYTSNRSVISAAHKQAIKRNKVVNTSERTPGKIVLRATVVPPEDYTNVVITPGDKRAADSVKPGKDLAVSFAQHRVASTEFLHAEISVIRGFECEARGAGPCGVCLKCHKKKGIEEESLSTINNVKALIEEWGEVHTFTLKTLLSELETVHALRFPPR